MPYESKDVKRFTKKATSRVRTRQWLAVERSAISRGASEGSAIRQANAAVKKSIRSKRSKRTRSRSR